MAEGPDSEVARVAMEPNLKLEIFNVVRAAGQTLDEVAHLGDGPLERVVVGHVDVERRALARRLRRRVAAGRRDLEVAAVELGLLQRWLVQKFA